MTRVSAFRGTWAPNRRPFVSLTPDVYVSIQGETSVIACGECRREIDLNRYVTAVNTEASVDSPPGSATITLSVPDTDVNNFYVDGRLVIMSMMEIEVYAKGYYTVGGTPQYYRTFWGIVSSVTRSWSNGVTTVSLQCKDILRWWELTNFATNAAWTDQDKTQSGWSMFGNYFAGMNPYTVIIALAREAMGDFSLTQGSFLSFRPEYGAEQQVVAQYAKDIMAYWQLKFGNIWNSLVLYGSSGQAYTFSGVPGDTSPLKISKAIFEQESQNLGLNPETNLFKTQPSGIAVFKKELSRAAELNFFQTDTQSKLQIAMTAAQQAGAYEFYCDPTGDIVFKPPFYNLNVLPNKPVSWIQDFEMMDDSITDNEQDVYTHVTSHGNAFGGVMDWGLNSDITTPRTGVIDWHLLKRYGWRRIDVEIEWAGDAKKLFYHLLDHIDKVNSKRESGTVTIPMRPELRMGFPVWIPRYDAFFYVSGVSHSFAVGGQATTTLQLTAKRGKFIAPKNIGRITASGGTKPSAFVNPDTKKTTTVQEPTYVVNFPSNVGETMGLTETGQTEDFGGPMVLREPRTGKLLGFPNAVMVYRQTLDGQVLSRILQQSGSTKGAKPKTQDQQNQEGPKATYDATAGDVLASLQNNRRSQIVDRLRLNRYEAGMTNAGLYDYAHDVGGAFLEFSVIPADKISWDPSLTVESVSSGQKKQRQDALASDVKSLEADRKEALARSKALNADRVRAEKDLASFKRKNPPKGNELSPEARALQTAADLAASAAATAATQLKAIESSIASKRTESQSIRTLTSINIMVRPVSDEFGFEVIGHYRYGRGAFIDRGQVQLPDPNQDASNPQTSVNHLDIQFAAVGGLLTDNPTQTNTGPQSANYGEMFEKMSPDDYVTGASFKGSNYVSGAPVQEMSTVKQSTYTKAINDRAGKAVFTEADAVRRAVTLAELSPTLSTGLSEVGYNRCSCSLSRSSWLTVLPQNLIRQILGPVTSVPAGLAPDVAAAVTDPSAEGLGADGIAGVVGQSEVESSVSSVLTAESVLGNGFDVESPGGFFSVLRDYLQTKFTADYRENARREQYARNGGRTVVRPNDGAESSNSLKDPQSPLFQRAAAGDPDALKALQGEVNLNFGRTTDAVDRFDETFKDGGPQDQLTASAEQFPGSIWDATKRGLVPAASVGGSANTGAGVRPQYQPPGRVPKIGETINPGPPQG